MCNRYSESILLPNLIRIKNNLIIAKFELMKILPAKYIIDSAIRNNKISPEIPIVETSSGSFALGLGIVCTELKLPFYIISDSSIDPLLEQQLIQLGGKVQILPMALTQNNPQEVRLKELKEYLKNSPKSYWTCQYDNLDNQNSYNLFADYLIKELGKNFSLVGAVGSGGSTCGTIKKIREANYSVRLIGVDTFGSILFGLPNKKRILRGLGNSIMPKNLYHQYFDEVHWVNANDAFFYTRKLYSETSLFCGGTTGAAYQVAHWLSEKNPNDLIVFIAADTGHRYLNTIYNNFWLKENDLRTSITKEPTEIFHPLEATKFSWCHLKWKRRYYNDVVIAL